MRRFGPGGRLFAVFAALSLVPVLALGALLAIQNRHQAQDRGIAQAEAQAEVIARVLGETELDGASLQSGLTPAEQRRVEDFTAGEVESGSVTRLRLRAPNTDVVFSSDGTRPPGEDDEAFEALNGEPVAEITRLDSDGTESPSGPRNVEVCTPLRNPRTGRRPDPALPDARRLDHPAPQPARRPVPADIAMYAAKRTHGVVVSYDAEHDHYNEERLALVGCR